MKVPITGFSGNPGRAIALIKAAINGGRTKAEHSSVPVYPDEQASAVSECLKAGADAIHLHVRSSSGDESLHADDVARTLMVVRSAAPNAPIGVSTGAWILPDPLSASRQSRRGKCCLILPP